MKKALMMGLILAVTMAGSYVFAKKADVINGAGATFPYPIYAQWIYEYGSMTGVKINYQSVGSGTGINWIKEKTVDFGASDAPLEPAELDESGLIQFPMIMGGVAPVVNVKGLAPGQLKLTPELMGGIYLGKITFWDDPAIKQANPGVKLPRQAIAIIVRADGSGTTWLFTSYLDGISPEWHEKVGVGKRVDWPTSVVAGKGNEGVAANVQQIPGSIGYVEYAYAASNQMIHVQMQNKAGKFVSPAIETFQAAAANADWKNAPGFYLVLTNQPGDDSWPITGASFILVYKDQADPDLAKAMLAYFDWCYQHGQERAKSLHYVPIPQNVVLLVETAWTEKISSKGKPLWP